MRYFADFENSTKVVEGKVNTYLWGIVSEDNSIREYGIDLSSFFSYISTLETNPIIYFHNISWDGNFIVHHLIDNGYKFVEKINRRTVTKEFTWICDYNTNIYQLVVKSRFGTITFLDSYKILISSVDNLGKALELNKLEIDYDKYDKFNSKDEVPQELIDYLFRDIDIVRKFMDKFSEKVDKVKITIASTMYNEFRKFYRENNFRRDFENVLTQEQWDLVKRSYAGGFTAISPRYVGVDLKNIEGHSYDWNSMYPSIMKDYRMPYGKPTRYRIENTDLELYEIRIYKAIKVDNFLPANLTNNYSVGNGSKYFEEISDVSIVIWKDEWEEIKKIYEIDYEIIETTYFRSKYVFKEFIEKIKSEKVLATNPVDRYIAKIKQNSLYGKFGQSVERESKILVKDESMTLKGKRYGISQEWVEQKITSRKTSLSYIPIASYITSMSRTLLYRAMFDNRETFIYCDTDSLYLTSEGRNLKLDDNEYGFLKLEHKFDRFKALKSKCYILNDIETGLVVKVAGLPESGKRTLNFDNFYRGYNLGKCKLQKKHNIGGLILEEVEYTL